MIMIIMMIHHFLIDYCSYL